MMMSALVAGVCAYIVSMLPCTGPSFTPYICSLFHVMCAPCQCLPCMLASKLPQSSACKIALYACKPALGCNTAWRIGGPEHRQHARHCSRIWSPSAGEGKCD